MKIGFEHSLSIMIFAWIRGRGFYCNGFSPAALDCYLQALRIGFPNGLGEIRKRLHLETNTFHASLPHGIDSWRN